MDSIFDELTVEEYQSVTEYVAFAFNFSIPASGYNKTPVNASQANTAGAGAGGTNLTSAAEGNAGAGGDLNYDLTLYDSYIYNTFKHPTNKGEALNYLDQGGPLPLRYATVIAVRSGNNPPDVMEYKVGPLPLGPDSYIEPLYDDGEIPWVKRPSNDLPEAVALGTWAGAVMTDLKYLFLDFLGQCGAPDDPECEDNNITTFNVIPSTRENGTNRHVIILNYLSVGEGSSYELHHIPFAYKIDVTSQDYEEWDPYEFEFCGQGFETMEDLIYSYNNQTMRICSPTLWLQKNYSTTGVQWSEMGVQGKPRTANGLDKPGPRLYEPEGKRFSLLQGDSNTSRVFQWADWQGHVTSNPWTGLSFHDIRFKGERILFELSLNDQMVAYSGYTSAGQTFYLDAFDQLGASQYTLRPGYDCPETAAYMPVSVQGPYGQQYSYEESVCFFEVATGETAWRHYDTYEGADDARSVRQYEFVVRAVATLGNYDYIISVYFQLDGSIKCEVKMAGYMQAIYYDAEFGFTKRDLAYGTRVHYNTIGNIHDHLSSWKVDLDVGGINNSFHITSVKTGTYDDVFGEGSTPPWALPTDVMKYQDDQLIEEEAGYVLDYKVPAVYRFVNDQFLNSWGVPRGYGIFHGSTSTQLLPHSHPLTKAAAWSKYHIAVTQRKEEEGTSSKDYYDAHSPGAPVWSLDMALDGESIVNEDLVAWVSMGIQHIPRSEDVPLISNVGTDFTIKPINYFDHLASMDVVDSDKFDSCAASQGSNLFDYTYSAAGDNDAGNKAGFKYSGPLSSRDVFVPSESLRSALGPAAGRAKSPRAAPGGGPSRSPAAGVASAG